MQETTTRIRRDELLGLLDTEEPTQRITARMPAVTLEELLQPEEPPPPSIEVTFRRPARGTAPTPVTSSAPTDDAIGFDFDDDFDDERETGRLTIHDALRAAAAQAAGILGTVNGVPVNGIAVNGIAVNGTVVNGIAVNGIEVQVAGFDSAIIARVDAATLAVGSSPAITPPSSIDAAIDAAIDEAIDEAIDAEIHKVEIEAALDAVMVPAFVTTRRRFSIVALSFALSFIAGMLIMFLLS